MKPQCWPGCLAVVLPSKEQPHMTDRMVVCEQLIPFDASVTLDGVRHVLSVNTRENLRGTRVWAVRSAVAGSLLPMIDTSGRARGLPVAPIPELFLRPILPPPGELTPDPVETPINTQHHNHEHA